MLDYRDLVSTKTISVLSLFGRKKLEVNLSDKQVRVESGSMGSGIQKKIDSLPVDHIIYLIAMWTLSCRQFTNGPFV